MTEPTILLVGDFITDRTWLVDEPLLLENYNSRASLRPCTLVDPVRETDVAGGIGTVARSIGAATTNPIVVVGAWSDYTQGELNDHKKLVPPEGELSKRDISFRRVYDTDFTSVKTRVYLPEFGGARLCARIDRNCSIRGDVDPNRYDRTVEWPNPEEVGLVILGDYGYGVLELPEVQKKLKDYVECPIIFRASNADLVTELAWDVVALNLHHCAKFLEVEPFDPPLTKRVNDELIYDQALVDALEKMAVKTEGRALLLNLESEGALLLHERQVYPCLLASDTEIITGIGANDVLLAHFALMLLDRSKRGLEDNMKAGCERGVRASAVFASRASAVEDMAGWCTPRVGVTDHHLERATPILPQSEVSLKQLRNAVKSARLPPAGTSRS